MRAPVARAVETLHWPDDWRDTWAGDAPASSVNEPKVGRIERRWILGALMLTMLLAAMDSTIVSTAIPQIVADLGGFAWIGWVFSIYLLLQMVCIPIYGKLADLHGRKPILLFGTGVFLLGSACCALAWNMPSLIVFRGLQGLGAGAIMATIATLVGDLYTVRERAAIQGWLSSVWGVAAITGPTLGGAFVEFASWRWIFLINLPLGAVALLLVSRFLKEQVERREHRIDFTGAALILLGTGVLFFVLLEGGQAWPWRSWQTLAGLALATVLLVAAWRVERRAAEPTMPGWLWRRRNVALSNLAMVGLGIVLMGPNTYLPTFGQSVLGLGAIAAGLLLATISLGWPLASSGSGRLYLRIGFRNTALVGAVLALLAPLLFAVLPEPQPLLVLVVIHAVLGAGFGLMSTPLLVALQSAVGWAERGVVTGANMFSRYLGMSLGAVLVGALFNHGMRGALQHAPQSAGTRIPADMDAVVRVLHDSTTAPALADYLRQSMTTATVHVYAGIAVAAALTLLAILGIRRDFARQQDSDQRSVVAGDVVDGPH